MERGSAEEAGRESALSWCDDDDDDDDGMCGAHSSRQAGVAARVAPATPPSYCTQHVRFCRDRFLIQSNYLGLGFGETGQQLALKLKTITKIPKSPVGTGREKRITFTQSTTGGSVMSCPWRAHSP